MDDMNAWSFSKTIAESWTVKEAEEWTDKHDNGDYDFITEMTKFGEAFVCSFYI